MTTNDTNTGQQFTPTTEAEEIMYTFVKVAAALSEGSLMKRKLPYAAREIVHQLNTLQAHAAPVPAVAPQVGRFCAQHGNELMQRVDESWGCQECDWQAGFAVHELYKEYQLNAEAAQPDSDAEVGA